MQLRPYQKEGIKFIKAHKVCLLADDMGLGKTAQAVNVVKDLNLQKILVVPPATMKIHWARKFNAWGMNNLSCTIVWKKTQKISNVNIIIVNYALVISKKIFNQLKRMEFDIIICDESHYLKTRGTKRTAALIGRGGLRKRSDRFLALTGTPILNRPIELFPMIKWFFKDLFHPYTDYMRFAYQYCGAYLGEYGFVDTGSSNEEDLHEKLKTFMLRRRIEDVLDELPDTIIQKVELPLDKKIQAIIEEEKRMTEELILKFEKMGDEFDPAVFMLGEQGRLRQKVALAKIPESIGFIKDTLEKTEKIGIFAWHRAVIKELEEQLKEYDPAILHGGHSGKQRQKAIDKFIEEEKCRVFIGNIQAAGVGVDGLQNVCSTVVFVEPSWVPKEIEQAIARFKRMGQKNCVRVKIIVVQKSVESDMIDKVISKIKTIDKIIEGGDYHELTKNKKSYLGNLNKNVINLMEGEMSIEKDLKRMADALEKVVELLENPIQETTGSPASATGNAAGAAASYTEADIRSAAQSLCDALPEKGEGKEAAKKIINEIGGGKIADVPAEKIEAVVLALRNAADDAEM